MPLGVDETSGACQSPWAGGHRWAEELRGTWLGSRDGAADFLLDAGRSALSKIQRSDHFTASCLVFDLSAPDGRVLLQRHRKTGRFMQFGGHVEPADTSFAAAAARELTEESGIGSPRWFSPAPLEVTAYDLPADIPDCSRHWDVLFAADVSSRTPLECSAESHALGWFSLAALPDQIMPDLPDRLPQLWTAARAFAAQCAAQRLSALLPRDD